ncbi:MAG TPA: DUF3696 domain-containing protein [Blastocatellia bacterium]
MLLLLKQTVDSPDRRQVLNLGDGRTPVELGTFPEILFAHNSSMNLQFHLEWDLPQPLVIEDPAERQRILFQGDVLGFSSEISWKANGGQTTQFPPEWKLSSREAEVASLMLSGRKNKEIAKEIERSTETVNKHLDHVYRKAGVEPGGGRQKLSAKMLSIGRAPSSADTAEGRAIVERMAYDFSDTEFGMKPVVAGATEYGLLQPKSAFQFIRSPGRAWKLPAPAKFYGFPDQVRGYYQNAGFLSDFELRFEEQFSRLYYLGPLREYPKRQYSWAGSRPSDMGRRGERVVDALLASRETGRTTAFGPGQGRRRQTVEQRVAEWLKELGLIASFEVRPISKGGKLFQVWVRRRPSATDVLLTDVGFGVSQILPVITICYYAPEGSTLLLEQPEIHLHPAVQAGLADVLIDAIKTRRIQIILESHSEHLLRRVQRRIAEQQFERDHAAIYFCSMPEGESHLTPLKIDPFGNIENWPEDFFGDEMGEIAAMTKAALRRKKRMA